MKIGCDVRKAATRVGFCQRSMGLRLVGLFGQEKRCWDSFRGRIVGAGWAVG